MSGFSEFETYDALGLAQLVHTKEISPSELVKASIDRIEAINPKINAVITPIYEEALKAAKGSLAEGPFKGVPILLKDLAYQVAGVRLSNGSKSYLNYIPKTDNEPVTRLKQAGFILVGKTNTPEFGLMGVTEPEAFGPTRNPWDLSVTPGGSSGGSGAAVAARLTPVATAGDGGGSIRIPASFCGLFGLKPSRGRVPVGPEFGELWFGAVANHILSFSVRDSAALLDILAGPDVGAPFIIQPPSVPYLQAIETPIRKLRIGFCTESPLKSTVHPENAEVIQRTATLLEELGHRVEQAAPNYDGIALGQAYFAMYFGDVAHEISKLRQVLGRKPRPSDVEATTWSLGLLGSCLPAGEFVAAQSAWNEAGRAMGRYFQNYDLYLTPSVATPPVKIGALLPNSFEKVSMGIINHLRLGKLLRATGLLEKVAMKNLEATPFTQLANLTGLPAVSVPLFEHSNGLPCGSQFVAPFGREDLLLQLGVQLEQARPWAQRRPPHI